MSKRLIESAPETRSQSRRRIVYENQHSRTFPMAVVAREMRNKANESAEEFMRLRDIKTELDDQQFVMLTSGVPVDLEILGEIQAETYRIVHSMESLYTQWRESATAYAQIRELARMHKFPGQLTHTALPNMYGNINLMAAEEDLDGDPEIILNLDADW